ncbi:MAG TPA: hypothetical protein VML95_13030 [Longimicrobiales bacterium]|nr:hypothetical protein [Longimicrobiales bacterium]
MATTQADKTRPRWLAYGFTSLVLVSAAVLALGAIVSAEQAAGLRIAGAAAWSAQILAFWLIARADAADFVIAWVWGMILRFATVGLAVVWVATGHEAGAKGLLLGLVGLLFVLSLLEAQFLGTTENAT